MEEGLGYLPGEGFEWEKVMFPDTTYIPYCILQVSTVAMATYGSTVHYSTVVL